VDENVMMAGIAELPALWPQNTCSEVEWYVIAFLYLRRLEAMARQCCRKRIRVMHSLPCFLFAGEGQLVSATAMISLRHS
jgi:hypothetical protein